MRFKNIAGLLLLLIVAGIIAVLFTFLRDTKGPDVVLSPDNGYVSAKAPLALELNDAKSGLRSVLVMATQGDKNVELLKKNFDKSVSAAKESLSFEGTKLKDGPIEVTVTALDASLHRFGAGAKTEKKYSLVYDSKPPVVNVLSIAHNMVQGGAGCVVYSINKDVKKSGVMVDDLFFPGFKLENGNYACLFAFPYYMPMNKFLPKIVATDMAGNERTTGFYFHAKPRVFRHDNLNVSDNFLNSRMSQFEDLVPDAKTPLQIFLEVNRSVRIQDAKILYDIGMKSAPKQLWDGSFQRQPNASPMAGFGDVRSYFYNGEKVDEQTHLGVDLASLMQAPIPAANNGTIMYADFLGIYGNCVIIDHGLGLQSLYAHMSQIDVKVGDTVTKGQIIGKTGTTGMAGGDHLHFGMLLSGLPVIPTEWWDDHWIRDNVTSKFNATGNQGQTPAMAKTQAVTTEPPVQEAVTGHPAVPPRKGMPRKHR